MGILKKANIAPPVLPKETVEVPELGGAVVVRGLLLDDRLRLLGHASAGNATLSLLLAETVVDADEVPVYSQEEWQRFGAQSPAHFSRALELFKVARRLNGLDAEAAEKNS